MNLTDRLITAIVEKCDGLSITAEQASNILAYLQYGAPLARQPAAIGKEAVMYQVETSMGWVDAGNKWQAFQSQGRNVRALYAAPLDKEASKPAAKNCQTGWADICHMAKHDGVVCPDDSCDIDDGTRAAPSVEQDERGAFLTWWCEDVPEYMREKFQENVDGFLKSGNATDKLFGAWEGFQFGVKFARAASTSANVASESGADTGNAEADRIIGRLSSSDPDFDDCIDAVAFIRKLVAEHKGPDGFATWKDAALAERMRRTPAQIALTDDARDAVRHAALEEAIQIIETHRVPVGNSPAGEMAAEWTMDALHEIRDAIRELTAAQSASGADHAN